MHFKKIWRHIELENFGMRVFIMVMLFETNSFFHSLNFEINCVNLLPLNTKAHVIKRP